MKHVLVIAYGNRLRSDDGIAWQAGEVLRRELPDGAKVICVHQLTPELAEDIALADRVIFLDASSKGEPGSIRCHTVFAQPGELRFSHQLEPGQVLYLSQHLYSADPQAFLISIAGQCFAHGCEFSAATVQALPRVVTEVCQLVSL